MRVSRWRNLAAAVALVALGSCSSKHPSPLSCTGMTACAGQCVDLESSPDDCGACGVVCSVQQVCALGTCKDSCPAGLVACESSCIDPHTSAAHCGASGDCQGAGAGVSCTSGQACTAGSCVRDDGLLSTLTVSGGVLSPVFAPTTTMYVVSSTTLTTSVTVTPTAASAGTTITVNGSATVSGSASSPIATAPASATTITVVGKSASGAQTSYTLVVMRDGIEYLKASNTGAGGLFGGAVALSGDTLVVGAPGEPSSPTGVNGNQSDSSAAGSGAVYVFVRSGTTWTQEAYLKASNTGAGDGFGSSVSVSGDTVVVGAPNESSDATGVNGDQADNSAMDSGAAYVFVRSGTTWMQEAYLKASDTAIYDGFGSSVSLSGDTVAVGGPGEVGGPGAVYVFLRSGTTWTQQAELTASNSNPSEEFGSSVALSGDTLAVGASCDASGATGVNGNESDDSADLSGAVFVFIRTGTTWTQQAYLKASNTNANDEFGNSVALSGDTLAVGANFESSSATGVNGDQSDNSAKISGAVYVFVRSGTTWAQQAYLKASNTNARDFFGSSVALSGDTLAVGAWRECSSATGVNGNQSDNSAAVSGAVYIFVRSGTTWAQQAYVKASNTGEADVFGWGVALSGDTAAVGARGESSAATGVNGDQSDNSAPSAGAVYLYSY